MAAPATVRAVLAAICLLMCLVSVEASELCYPSGYPIAVDYTVSTATLSTADTLVITRTIINKTTFPLSGLYFSDNLHPNFVLIGQSARRNRTTVTSVLTTDRDSPAVPGQVAYYWIFDDPDSLNPKDLLVSPGDSVTLTAKFRCTSPGEYQLPLHTTVFYGGNPGGFFATSESRKITVAVATGVDDGNQLPDSYFTSRAYPNPFNGVVTIQYTGTTARSVPLELVIFNTLGQQVYSATRHAEAETGELTWNTSPAVGSGVYFYRLSYGQQTSTGKLMLLK